MVVNNKIMSESQASVFLPSTLSFPLKLSLECRWCCLVLKQYKQQNDQQLREGRPPDLHISCPPPPPPMGYILMTQQAIRQVCLELLQRKGGNQFLEIFLYRSLKCVFTLQAQSAWLQHDFGHLSVFKNMFKLDQLLHYFTMGFLKVKLVPASTHLVAFRNGLHALCAMSDSSAY